MVVAAGETGSSLQVAYGSYPKHGARPFDALAFVLTILANTTIVFRRRAPRVVFVICTSALVAFLACGYWRAMNQLGAQTAFFTIATRCRRRWIVLAALILYPVIMYGNVHTWIGSKQDIFVLSAGWLAALGIFGDGTRRLATHNKLVVAHAEQLRREVVEREERAALDERMRIARELHDTVAHHLSVIAVQANLARYVVDSNHERAKKAMSAVAETASEGLAEARRIVAILRPDNDDPHTKDADSPQIRGIADLPAMIERIRLTGQPVRLSVTGEQRPVPTGISSCVYRVVQEALTNVLKHAHFARAEVLLHYSDDELRVSITDDGNGREGPAPGTDVELSGTGGGRGLRGMRERAQWYGGMLAAGKNAEGGFEVTLVVPTPAISEA